MFPLSVVFIDSVVRRKATLAPVAHPKGPTDRAIPSAGIERERPFWGLGDAAAGWMLGFVLSAVAGGLALALGPWDMRTPPGTGGHLGAQFARAATDQDLSVRMPLSVQVALTVPLWIGLFGVPVWVAAKKGFGVVSDFRLRQEWTDIPLGIAVGVASQFGLVWAIYRLLSPWIDPETVDDAARDLTDRATTAPAIIMLVLLVAIGAPIVEEVFFRGLLFRALDKRWSRAAAIVVSSVFFGLSHFQLIQFPALVAFGLVLVLLVHFTDRLGPAIWAHVAFNTSTLIVLLLF